MTKPVPALETFIQAIKKNFPNEGNVTLPKVQMLENIWGTITYQQLGEAYRTALKKQPNDPLPCIYQQLSATKPSLDDLLRQDDAKNTSSSYNWQGRKIESGMDWDAIYAEKDRKEALKKQAYDQKHGKGAYDKMEADDLHQLHQFFVDLENKTFPPVEEKTQEIKPKTAEDIKADKEVDKLINDTLELLDRREKAKKEKKPGPVIPKKHKTINLKDRREKLQAQLREAEQRG